MVQWRIRHCAVVGHGGLELHTIPVDNFYQAAAEAIANDLADGSAGQTPKLSFLGWPPRVRFGTAFISGVA
ncbi:MAG: hypothetical protein ABI051_00765 [Vicinamibacterales bacterium]